MPEQPIFDPVTADACTETIARDRNATRPAPDDWGPVTCFALADAVAARYPVQPACGRAHAEHWIPAEDLAAVDDAIDGVIQPLAAWRGGAGVGLEEALAGNGGGAWPRS
ncbi:MAG: ADP-ribosylation/crystallin J1 [Pseudomonadota bacterium]